LAATLKRWLFKTQRETDDGSLPAITVVIAAYNEEDFIRQKIENCLSLEYPHNRCSFIIVTDGSTDHTPAIVAEYAQVQLMHQPVRAGKASAIHRAMEQVRTEVVVFTDANTLLNTDALMKINRHYADPRTGAVAGEKRVRSHPGATAGEGWYWQYESRLKHWESELYSVMGAAGELFSIRTGLYEPVPADTLLDDFLISVHLMRRGYRIGYEPDAFATENASMNIREEWKRKVRIAAGGMQMLLRSGKLFSPTRPLLLFEYISHRVLRWIITPWLLILVFLLNLVWIEKHPSDNGYMFYFFWIQILWYSLAVLGWILQKGKINAKWLFIPYYFCMMNAAMIAGVFRFLSGRQTVFWEKAGRTV
jgi:biofilm PGA synthesis N-glycosyltransferase PgaC